MHTLMHQISIIYRCAILYRDEKLAGSGLSGKQTPYLVTLYHHPGLSQEELSQKLHVNKSSVTRQLNQLEKDGFAMRCPAPEDKRILQCFPTNKSLEMQATIRQVLQGWNDFLTAELTQEERDTLSHLMERLSDKASAYVEGRSNPCEPSDDI